VKYIALNEIAEVIAGQSPPSDSYNQIRKGLPFFQGKADFGDLYPTVRYWCVAPKKISYPNDILFSVRAPVGPTNLNNTEACIGRGLAAVRCGKHIDTSYLLHFLRANEERIANMGTGSTFKAITIKDLKSLKIPLPPLPEQKRIAEILDKADALRQKNKQLLAAYDELLQATFLDMFGDPVSNPKGWKLNSLSIYGDFKNGLNFSKEDEGVEIRCIGVGDFKDKSIFVDLKSIRHISLSSMPKDDYFLKNGDLIFVRSNGNRELVGRCLVVYPGTDRVSYSGFCIRFRVKNDSLSTVYLSHLFRIPSFKRAMLQNGRGANIQNINQGLLANLRTPIPPKKIQQRFSRTVENIEAQKALVKQSLQQSEDLFHGLVQKEFSGHL
tara:strand:- start:172 stop:1320 length:1149 start_codon:yes stop_codon:yes gene_type:complete